ncbi:NAD-dependent glucose-6-phosphate dehydrogenase [Candidatus Gugararchaeum adminiculabundum]|nr:NAD-dependent glucose-6-phosphate dehydrogenase [Candidatus Gugararchaeum adminiculabundum]
MATVLVTGATGRVGRVLVKQLMDRKFAVRVLIRNREHAMLLPKGVESVYGDIVGPNSSGILENAVKDVEYVFHLAAVIDERLSYTEMRRVNVEGTENLLTACSKHGVGVKRFVHVSSISVYGRKTPCKVCSEKDETKPDTKYGRTKLEAEKVVEAFYETVPSVIIRPAVVYGKGFDEAYFQVLRMLEKGKMPIIGNGSNRIPFVHVNDVVQALLLACEKNNAVENAFNICGAEQMTQKEIFAVACENLKVTTPTRSFPVLLVKVWAGAMEVIDSLRGRKPRVTPEYIDIISRDRAFAIKKAREMLGYAPKVGLKEGIKEMVQYYKEGNYVAKKN